MVYRKLRFRFRGTMLIRLMKFVFQFLLERKSETKQNKALIIFNSAIN